ncbi:MAG TPA: serine protease [Kaistia sp.]|nr:serine protease [Kaistia sp.]
MRAVLLIIFALFITPAAAFGPSTPAVPPDRSPVVRVNIIDGEDGRDSLVRLGPSLGLDAADIARIRAVSGYVGCLSPSPSVGSAALFLDNQHILTAAHVFFEPSGQRRWKCFFKNQAADPVMIDLLVDDANARFGARKPKPGSNNDYAIVRLAEPLAGAMPFPVAADMPVTAGEKLIVVTAHPADMAREVDRGMPVVQGCTVRRKPVSTEKTSFFRTDCDATGASSGGMNLARINGTLAFRGIIITTGPWRDPALNGAPYNEKGGSVTTALGTDAAILAAGRSLAGGGF